ncbi:unnamed protein product, partial [Urochloa humidicola]
RPPPPASPHPLSAVSPAHRELLALGRLHPAHRTMRRQRDGEEPPLKRRAGDGRLDPAVAAARRCSA